MRSAHVLSTVVFVIVWTSQVIGLEIQVPMDTEGRTMVIDPRLEERLKLFGDHDDFQRAWLFKLSDSLYVLEVFRKSENAIVKSRLRFTEDGVSEFRARVSSRLLAMDPAYSLDRSGRNKFVAGELFLSLGFYGWAIPAAIEVDDGRLALGMYMLTSGLGFYIPFELTRNAAITDGAATLSLYGATRGVIHGIALAEILSDDPSYRGRTASAILTSITGSIVGYQLASRTHMNSGTAEAVSVGGDLGMGIGLGSAYLSNLIDDHPRGAGVSVLAGSGLGCLAGAFLASKENYTRGDAYVLSGATVLGAYVPLVFADFADPDNNDAYISVSMLGGTAGFLLGHLLVNDREFGTGEGNLIRLGGLAGGLIGLGCAYLFSSEQDDNTRLYLSASAIGATTGFGLLYKSYSPKNRHVAESSWNINLRPETLITLALKNPGIRSYDHRAPLLELSYRF